MNPLLKKALIEAGTKPGKEIAQQYNIEFGYFRTAASKRGISLAFKLNGVKKKAWSRQESKFLKVNAQTMTAKEIGSTLNRTELSIRRKANELGLFLQKHGEYHHLSHISNNDVELCRVLSEEGLSANVIAEKMEIELSHVHSILSFRARVNG